MSIHLFKFIVQHSFFSSSSFLLMKSDFWLICYLVTVLFMYICIIDMDWVITLWYMSKIIFHVDMWLVSLHWYSTILYPQVLQMKSLMTVWLIFYLLVISFLSWCVISLFILRFQHFPPWMCHIPFRKGRGRKVRYLALNKTIKMQDLHKGNNMLLM